MTDSTDLTVSPAPGNQPDATHGRLTVTVYDEDAGGPPMTFPAGPGEKVGKLVEEIYQRLGEAEKPGDRLLCQATGEPVNSYREMRLRDYAAGRCADLVWTLARDTGGA
jgi:hypothetical protein